MRLISIPKEKYEDYRLAVIFDGYKWDPQFLDDNTIARHALVLSQVEHQELVAMVEKLGQETELAEQHMRDHPHIIDGLKLPRKMKKTVPLMMNYDPKDHIRLMRFDFHPLEDGGWAISEVNSDVPGGFAEASLMPQIALANLDNPNYDTINFGEIMVKALRNKIKTNGTIMMAHCTSYSDDRQVMQFLGDQLEKVGYQIIYGAVDHLEFKDGEAYCILDNNQRKVDGIVRFNPIEWVVDIKPNTWNGYFNTITPSCNHPLTVLAQSKRFPLIWDDLEKAGLDLSAWRSLLPHTMDAKTLKDQSGYIYKPVWGRVGEGISIKEAVSPKEYDQIMKDVKKHPSKYIAQKQFMSKPAVDEFGNEFHVCLGAYYVEGKAAGYYARLSKSNRTDSHAQDVPVLIERNHHEG